MAVSPLILAFSALDVGIDGGFVGDVLVDAHQAGVHLADAAALGAIEYITLGRAHKAVFDQHTLDGILHFFTDGSPMDSFFSNSSKHLARQLFSRFDGLGAVAGTERLHDGVGDLLRIKETLRPSRLMMISIIAGASEKLLGRESVQTHYIVVDGSLSTQNIDLQGNFIVLSYCVRQAWRTRKKRGKQHSITKETGFKRKFACNLTKKNVFVSIMIGGTHTGGCR